MVGVDKRCWLICIWRGGGPTCVACHSKCAGVFWYIQLLLNAKHGATSLHKALPYGDSICLVGTQTLPDSCPLMLPC